MSGGDQLGLRRALAAWLDWQAAMGADAAFEPEMGAPIQPLAADASAPEAGHAAAREREAQGEAALPDMAPRPIPGDRIGWAREVASACRSLAELEAALDGFEGCPLRVTATRLCFADGAPDARVMLIGEAPGAEEDRQGKPFVGQSGQLLDRILATIGLDRTNTYITNCIYWRPPGNRPPTTAEIAVCQPFLERQIELIAPRFILFLGGTAARVLLGRADGVTKLRGRRYVYQTATGTEIAARVTFHPAYLLRQPIQKRFVWRDMLQLQAELRASVTA